MVFERRKVRRTDTDRLADRVTDSLTDRRKRGELRQQVQAEDLDIAPPEVTRLVRMRLLASLGGQARAKVLTAARRQAIAKRAAQARWGSR